MVRRALALVLLAACDAPTTDVTGLGSPNCPDAAIDSRRVDAAPPDAPRPHRVLVEIWGQSNAEGKAYASTLTDKSLTTPQPLVPYTLHDLTSPATSAPPWITYSGPLAPYRIDNSTPPMMGAELSLGRALRPAAMDKVAIGSSSLYAIWCTTCTYPSDQLPENYSRSAIDQASSAMAACGCDQIVLVWRQGETDSRNATQASAYAGKMSAEFGAFRARFPGAPIVVGRLSSQIGTLPGYVALATVRAAEEAWVASDPLSALVNQDDLPLQASPSPHFTADGYDALGQRDAAAIQGLLAR